MKEDASVKFNPLAMNRRDFIKWSSIVGCTAAVIGSPTNVIKAIESKTHPFVFADRVVRLGCPAHNCGGRCLLKVSIKDGKIIRIETDDRPTDKIEDPQLRACIRGRAYRKRQYHPDRLKYPLKRIGKRGEGKFERISWDEALDIVAGQIKRVKEKYGNSAIYVPYGTGGYSQTNGRQTA